MMRKLFVILLAMMAVAINAAGETNDTQTLLEIAGKTQIDDENIVSYSLAAGETKFAEPSVRVVEQTKVTTTAGSTGLYSKDEVTTDYVITYSTLGTDGTTVGTESKSGSATIVTDKNTGTYVNKYTGDVIVGRAGTVYIKVTATPRSESGRKGVLTRTYKIVASATDATVSFYPEFTSSDQASKDYEINLKVYVKPSQYNSKAFNSPGAASAMPTYQITTAYGDNATKDITSLYDVAISFTLDENYKDAYASSNYLVYNSSTALVAFNSFSNCAEGSGAYAALKDGISGTLTYTFTPKTAATAYSEIVRTVHVTTSYSDYGEKETLRLQLDRAMFNEENVTYNDYGDGNYVIHVYRNGQCDTEYNSTTDYSLPIPALLTSENVSLPTSNGNVYDYYKFTLGYQIVSDETYVDSCQYTSPFWSKSTNIIQAGEETGSYIQGQNGTAGSYAYIHSGNKAGLVKIMVTAVAYKDYYSYSDYTIKDMYEPLKNEDGSLKIGTKETITAAKMNYENCYVYSEPVYFYVDFMHRRPTISLDPDPEDIVFLEGEKLTKERRFTVLASMTDANNNKAVEEVEKTEGNYTYTFFISYRNVDNGFLKITGWPMYNCSCASTNSENIDNYGCCKKHWYNQTDKDGNLADGDGYSYKALHIVLDEHSEGDDAAYQIRETDKIYVGKENYLTDDEVDTDGYVVITADNKDKWAKIHPYITKGDYEWGITYLSMAGYGNENWELEFLADGYYTIPYTIYSWNHQDFCSSTEIAVKFRYSTSALAATKLKLSYTYQVVEEKNNGDFTPPTGTVVVPAYNNLDITEYYDLSSMFSGTATTINSSELNYSTSIDLTDKSIVTLGDYTIYYYQNNKTDVTCNSNFETNGIAYYEHVLTGTKLYVETDESNKNFLGARIELGTVPEGKTEAAITITASAGRKNTDTKYSNPASVDYTILLVKSDSQAKWEIIRDCDNSCTNGTRYKNELHDGKLHFISVKKIYGGTEYEGTPGISMKIGAHGDNDSWTTTVIKNTSIGTCCNHDNNDNNDENGYIVVINKNKVQFDETGLPYDGAYYKFKPTTNGFLTIDAQYLAGHTYKLVSLNSSGELEEDEISPGDVIGDVMFPKPLLADREYYLYDDYDYNDTDKDAYKSLQMHGFLFEPAFIIDRTTTYEASVTDGITATIFANGLETLVPTISSTTNDYVTFEASDPEEYGKTASDYVELDTGTGEIKYTDLTLDDNGNIFNLGINATVQSTKYDCLAKTARYLIRALDIPTYSIPTSQSDCDIEGIKAGATVSTTNIPTDITMTFGGWTNTNGNYTNSSGTVLTDTWSWKGNNNRVAAYYKYDTESKTLKAVNDESYQLTIDGFESFNAASNNPIDENKKAYAASSDYAYASGIGYETEGSMNTTYNVPCRGAYLKFEPRETGTLIVYLVQNGSVDYCEGQEVQDSYQVKWRPVFITDQTGKPVEMENDFASDLLATGEDKTNMGSYTLGLSRCDPVVNDVAKYVLAKSGAETFGTCSFDWSVFKGNTADKEALLAAWTKKGERESIIRLNNGGFVLPHKAYVRYAFTAKAGKTYYVFQPGSKFEFGGFSFLPNGFPNKCKYQMNWGSSNEAIENDVNLERTFNEGNGSEKGEGNNYTSDYTFTWNKQVSMFEGSEDLDNVNIVINDRRQSELATADNKNKLVPRTMKANQYESICLPFSVSETQCKEVFGDDYYLLTFEGLTTDNKLHFVRHANRYIEAGRPYLIKPTKDIEQLEFKNITIEKSLTVSKYGSTTETYYATDPTRFNVDIEDGAYTFKGIYSRETMSAGSYHAEDDGLYRYVNSEGTPVAVKLGGYRAYLRKNTTSDSSTSTSAKAFSFALNDLTPDAETTSNSSEDYSSTDVMLVNSDGEITTVPKNAGVYSINGKKIGNSPLDLNNAPSGIYIINGIKVVK